MVLLCEVLPGRQFYRQVKQLVVRRSDGRSLAMGEKDGVDARRSR